MGSHSPLPTCMSLPEVMGDPCASELRGHAQALLNATEHADKLVRAFPAVEPDIAELRDSIKRHVAAVLETLAHTAGIPNEGQSISPQGGRFGDYRIDRSSGCWIWMRSVTDRGYPIAGRKANGRENVPAKIYWMLAHGPLAEHEIVVRTCDSRLCVNPDHGRVTDRREYGAACMREGSVLTWDAVHEIRRTLSASRDAVHECTDGLATRYGVKEHSILAVFRNKVWIDPDYTPGFEVKCSRPGCEVVFRTTSTVRKYHSEDCAKAGSAGHGRTRSRLLQPSISPARRAREEAARRAEAAAAVAEWSEVAEDDPRTSVWTVASVDQPVGDGSATLRDLLVPSSAEGDPAEELDRSVVRHLLGDLTEDQVASMSDTERDEMRVRLQAAGVRPSTTTPA